jgi:hypothetical protein
MKIENAIRLDCAAAQAPVPAAVKGLRAWARRLQRFGAPDLRRSGCSDGRFSNRLSGFGLRLLARKWLDSRCNASPELGFLRAE